MRNPLVHIAIIFIVDLLMFPFFMAIIPTAAQEPEKYSECEFDPTFTAIQDEFEKVTDWQTLEAFNEVMGSSLAYCMGLYWQGDGTQDSTVFGPFTIPAGIYRYVATTENAIIVEFEMLTDECDYFGVSIAGGEAVTGSETLYRSEQDCEVLMTVWNVQSPWVVEFRPVQ